MAGRTPAKEGSNEPARSRSRRAKPAVGASVKGTARREEILAGVVEKIARQELQNPSLREIGRALNLEPAHILYYFQSREALLQEVIERWGADARRRHAGSTNLLDNFASQIERNIEVPGIVHLYLYFATEAVDPQHPAHEFFKQRFLRVSSVLEQGIRMEQAAGLIPADVDPGSKARQLIAIADGLQLQSLVNPDINAARDLHDAISSLRSGIARP